MSQRKPILYIFDTFSLIFRAYYAMNNNPLVNSKGLNVSAILGFTNVLHDIIKNQKPDYLACAFDADHITDRQEEFEFYKANRQATPEDIKISVPYIKEIAKAFNIPVLEVNGYEADDLIGTIAIEAEKEGVQTYMVTPDKDMTQLVTENIFMYKPPFMGRPYQIMGLEDVKKKWEVNDPIQIIDILGLWGDAADNIPGVKGVGEKTAKKLIKEYDSIENIYEHIDEIKGSLKTKLEEGRENAFISKKLATIVTDAPVHFDRDSYKAGNINKEALAKLFTELEFRSLGKRILGDSFTVVKEEDNAGQMSLFGQDNSPSEEYEVPQAKTLENTSHDYSIVTDIDQLKKIMEKAQVIGTVAIDTETTGLDPMNCDLVGISLSYTPHEAYYIPWSEVSKKEMTGLFNEFLSDEKLLKVGQNIKYDCIVLSQHGIQIKAPFFDTMIAHYLINPEARHSMDFLSETYLGYIPQPIEDLIGKRGVRQLKMSDIDMEKVMEYAAEDADITLQLYHKLSPALAKDELEDLFNEIEIPLVSVLSEMEQAGVAVDVEFLENYSNELNGEIIGLQEEIIEISGVSFNLDSPKQLGEVLFEHMKIPYKGKKTKTGQYSTNEETLLSLSGEQPIIDKILDYRELRKLKSTYVDALPKLINPKTGLIHSTFNQTVVSTGRLSSTNPNLQNIPIRTERGRHIRKAFVPRGKGRKILSADYSQIELRIIASMSRDEKMMAAFEQGQDIHAATAANVYNMKLEEVTPTQRRNAKTVNFGIIYGISAFGLAQRLRIARTEAQELIDQYFEKYPGIKKYMEESVKFAQKHGYVQTLYGRRRYLRDINSRNYTVRSFAERNAINAPIQGSAADMIKLAMIRIRNKMISEKFKSQMILQVHDELLFDVWENEIEDLKSMVEKEMKNALKLNVPIEIGMGIGHNWLEAH